MAEQEKGGREVTNKERHEHVTELLRELASLADGFELRVDHVMERGQERVRYTGRAWLPLEGWR